MRLIFAGTPPFAAAALEALHVADHDIAMVLTQPDRPAGRGMKLAESAVGQMAARLGLRVMKPINLKDPETQQMLASIHPEVMIVAAYGLLLPQAVLDIPGHGCLNIHGSLLPRWRGAAPVQRAILAGDSHTGIDIMRMEAGLDTGPVLLQKVLAIEAHETSATLFEKLTRLGATAIVEALDRIDALTPEPQAEEGVTYAHKLNRAEAPIDWTRPAVEIDRQIRAFDPFPGAEASFGASPLKIWGAVIISAEGTPGTVLEVSAAGPVVACGTGALRLTSVQKPGGRRQPATEWARTVGLTIGQTIH